MIFLPSQKFEIMEDGAKRKLPPWMSRAGIASNTVGQSEAEKGIRIDNNLKAETAHQPFLPKSKAEAKLSKKDTCTANTTLDYEPKKRKSKTLNQGEGESNIIEVSEILGKRKKDGSGGRKNKSKRKETSYVRSEEIESPSRNEDDGELTVEDLVTIAQEYIRRDENSGQQHLSDECNDGKTNSAIALSVHDSVGFPYFPSQSNKEPFTPEETIPLPNIIIKTEDPAQDMLDLYLGPLLKKPVSEDKLIKTIEEDRAFVSEAKEQVHNNSIATGDFVPFTKKKSSLKDKMAMFFD